MAHSPIAPDGRTGLSATVSIENDSAIARKLGRYSILSPLDAGGMGVVYRAHDEALERTVAIKTLSPGVFSNEEARRRFRTEALALAKLSHAHIAAVYDVGQHEGQDYIVMECVPGESLAAKLETGPLSVKEATTLLLRIAEALEEAHEHGVVHRDLKPANVMVTPKGQPKVLDFGLAKLLAPSPDPQLSAVHTRGLFGTPLYMSPEQVHGKALDERTDLWSLGALYYELLTGRPPFTADSTVGVLRAITEAAPAPLSEVRPDAPPLAQDIVARALEKDPSRRYQSATEVIRDASDLLVQMEASSLALGALTAGAAKPTYRATALAVAAALVLAGAAGLWFYQRTSGKHWAREDAIPQIDGLLAAKKPIQAAVILEKARQYLPADAQLAQIAEKSFVTVSINSTPPGASIDIQDYSTPDGPVRHLGTTPLDNIRIPDGYFRWHVSKPGSGKLIVAPLTDATMYFSLNAAKEAPSGMVYSPGGTWGDFVAFIGWLGPFQLPRYYVDRHEVTNRDYQKFVDDGGYEKRDFWPQEFSEDGHTLTWIQAMAQFRDSSGRQGPSTWAGGHYPEGMADFPVTGVSWFEASAYAAFVGKRLPVLSQWFQLAPPDAASATVPLSNISTGALAKVGSHQGLGPFGTYDTAGNVREWIANTVNGNLRFILGGSWKSPSYVYTSPEALSPFDRSDANGFRCVLNIDPMPADAAAPIKRIVRDFSKVKPVSDEVFHAYEILYAYRKEQPLNAKIDGIIKETVDWREEKITFDAGYRGERMAAYLFLPKNVRPPYQTVLFFPSARVLFLPPDSKDGSELGDTKFFDYLLQSGRAVMYPIYQNTYERRLNDDLPNASQAIDIFVDRYKDAARSLDYLATRSDIDSNKLAYLGVSMGSAYGVIFSELLQDRLKTAVFLDGGYFLDPPTPGADQADFAVRMKKPVLMINGRYDFSFSLDKAQEPLFTMLGTPAQDKRHVIMETPHDVTQDHVQLVKEVLAWFDHYLGRVGE